MISAISGAFWRYPTIPGNRADDFPIKVLSKNRWFRQFSELFEDIREFREIALMTFLLNSERKTDDFGNFRSFSRYPTIPGNRADDFPFKVLIKTEDFGNFWSFSKIFDNWKNLVINDLGVRGTQGVHFFHMLFLPSQNRADVWRLMTFLWKS